MEVVPKIRSGLCPNSYMKVKASIDKPTITHPVALIRTEVRAPEIGKFTCHPTRGSKSPAQVTCP